jgi:hypothetical protein
VVQTVEHKSLEMAFSSVCTIIVVVSSEWIQTTFSFHVYVMIGSMNREKVI